MSDVNAVAVVHFVKHWDNNTKGYMELPADTLAKAIERVTVDLADEILAEDVPEFGDKSFDELVTITKATWGVSSNWIGV